ncbi:unnamed protein product [Adineta ricciae]|uniref:G-protein coupled receptors family 1 profile domain-containing protein n=1 Tax=Adineta ricciae TaxID=249248 RepID=A0A815F111_ADIRI|nr:unnamed protein product [Adineta ricciae]
MSSTASSTNYTIIAPISILFSTLAIVISCFVLLLVSSTKQLYTVRHLLTCNTCLASIFYCIVQCNNYIYLLFIQWNTSNESCRWRGYFGYVSMAAVIYSYLLQSIARLFVTFYSMKYRWIISFKIHVPLIFIGWIIVFIVPLPAVITKDISFRVGFLCWVPRQFLLHAIYTVIMYYLIPILIIIFIYVLIYIRVHSFVANNAIVQDQRGRSNRELEVLRKIVILFSIYILGPLPLILYMLTNVELFYSIGIVSISFAVMVEKLVSLLIDRDIRNAAMRFFGYRTNQVLPIAINIITPGKKNSQS